MMWATKVLWPHLPDEVRDWAVPAADETASQRRARQDRWEAWLSATPWAREILQRASAADTKAARADAAAKESERAAFQAACRAAGLTAPMSQAQRAHLLGIWRRTGRIAVGA